MPAIVTPGRLTRLAEFYHQLGAMLSAGITLVQSLEQIQSGGTASVLHCPVPRILESLRQGHTFTESLTRLGGWLPPFDLALIQAGELSGRLDVTCRQLAAYYRDRAQLARQVMSDLALPVFIVHAAVFLAAFPRLFLTGEVGPFLRQTLGVLAPMYFLTFWFLWACQGKRGAVWRGALERILHPLPILGKARRHLALARLAAALDVLLNAGVPVQDAWLLAAAASASPALERATRRWPDRLNAGETPAELLRASPEFPAFFSNCYGTGEVSGTLDDALKRLREYYQDDATRKLHMVAEWTPRLIYLAIVVLMAFRIIGFWTSYYDNILSE